MANDAIAQGVRLLFQPLEEPVLLPALHQRRTGMQQISLDEVARANYHAVEVMVYLAADAEAPVTVKLFGTGLSESTGHVLMVHANSALTRRVRLAVGSDRHLSAKLSAPVTDCWLRVVGTWS